VHEGKGLDPELVDEARQMYRHATVTGQQEKVPGMEDVNPSAELVSCRHYRLAAAALLASGPHSNHAHTLSVPRA
jgi:hypothetical protein